MGEPSGAAKPRGCLLVGLIKLGLYGVIAFLLLGVVAILVSPGRPRPGPGPAASSPPPPPAAATAPEIRTPKQSSASLSAGDEAIIGLDGAVSVFLAVTDDAWNPMLDAENARDSEEMALLIAKGKVIQERSGTRVKVLNRALTSTRVRIRDGLNPGAEAWIQYEEVHPLDWAGGPAAAEETATPDASPPSSRRKRRKR